MVPVDRVYQKVLAICNKEQRGYITPQEFNLLANTAQMEIFDSYFHDLKTAYHKPKTTYDSADESSSLKAKMHHFLQTEPITISTTENSHELPSDLYHIDVITVKYPTGIEPDYFSTFSVNDIIYNTSPLEEMDQKVISYTQYHPLTKAHWQRPVFTRIQTNQFERLKIAFYPNPIDLVDEAIMSFLEYTVSYWRKPISPKWGYVVVNGKALYNSNSGVSINFELHKSEEEILVNRILQLAGIIIESPGVTQVAMTDRAFTKQNQNN
tara:strand:+ start:366 stop:1166 length:801 start_codon:yes stop_codon:yes gene_type:complete